MAGNKIGELFFEFRTRGSAAVRSALKAIKGDAESVGRSFDDSLGRAGQKLEDTTQGARKLQGAITGIIAILVAVPALFFKLGQAINGFFNLLKDGKKTAQDFVNALNDDQTLDAAAKAKAVQGEITRLSKTLERSSASVFDWFEVIKDGGLGDIRKQIDELSGVLETLGKKLEVDARNKAREYDKQAEAARKVAEAENEALSAQNMRARASLVSDADPRASDELLIAAENIDLQRQLLDLDRQIADARKEYNDEAANALIARKALLIESNTIAIQGIRAAAAARDAERAEETRRAASDEAWLAELRKRLYRETLRENERAARETAQRIAQANADAIRDAANQASQVIESAINSQSGTFTRLEDLVNTIAQRLDRIERRQR